MSQQSDFGFWPKVDGRPLRPEITKKLLREVFEQRMLYADLLTRSSDEETAFMAKMVLAALTAVRDDLKRRIS